MIGVFGGAFAPFHNGHLRLAIEARDQLGLDRVHLIPTAQPPHRRGSAVAGATRLAWIEAAIQGEVGLIADDCELRRQGLSYTYHTVEALRARYPDQPLLLMIGADAFAQLHTWHRWQALLSLAHLLVCARPGAALLPSAQTQGFLASRRARVADELRAQNSGLWMSFDLPLLQISSTRIRQLLRHDRSVRALVPDVILNTLSADDRAALIADQS